MFDVENRGVPPPMRHKSVKAKAKLPPGCGLCMGRAWYENGHGEARRCTCKRGQALATKDREREAAAR